MSQNQAFSPQGGEIRVAVTATPGTPFQVTHKDGTGASSVRLLISNVTGTGELHIAYSDTSAGAVTIAGAGSDTPLIQTDGVMTFPASTSVEILALPPGTWLLPWMTTGGQTAKLYITPGEGI